MTDFTESEIAIVLKRYKERKEKDKQKYLKIKDNEDFKIQNRARAKEHYEKTKDLRKETYRQQKELMNAKNSFYYYKRNDRVDEFQQKYPDRYELLKLNGYFNEKNPSSSTSTS